jgi:hypothetical protein
MHLARHGIKDGRLDSEEGDGCRPWFSLNSTRQWSDNNGACFRLPEEQRISQCNTH